MEGTAKFVKYVTRMWNIINIRSTGSGFRLNDPDIRMPFNNLNDPKLDFLMKMATMFKRMDNSISGRRIKGLTCQTSNALHQTLVGFIELIKTLLHHGYKYP